MTVVSAWLRLELRRRWRSLCVLALLVAIAGAAVMATVAGARRQASVEQRLQDATRPAQVAIIANTPGYPWDKVRTLAEVEVLATFGASFPISGLPLEATAEPILGADMMSAIERPVVREGRMFNRSRLDEAVVTPRFVAHYHRGVGSEFDVTLPTPAELEAEQGSGPDGRPTGPTVHTRIVGVVISPWFSDGPGGLGQFFMSPAVAARYPRNVTGGPSAEHPTGSQNAIVRLHGGRAAIGALDRHLAALPGHSGIDLWNLDERFTQPAQRQFTFQARCLLAFGAAVFLAALVLIGQAIARSTAAASDELGVLRSLGLTPRDATVAAAAAPVLAGIVGAAAAMALAFEASRWSPIGYARNVEVNPGPSADWTVLATGAVAVVALVVVGSSVAAWSAWRTARRDVVPRRSGLATLVNRTGAPVPLLVGSRFALEAGRGRQGVPVRPALVGAVLGVVGVIGALVFSNGVADASTHLERFGQTHQLVAFLGANDEDIAPTPKVMKAIEADPGVAGVADVRVGVGSNGGTAQGPATVTLLTYTWGAKPLPTVVTSGRMPHAPDEVLLAPRSISALHTGVGSTVELSGTSAKGRFTVVGTGLMPIGFHNGYVDGGWVTDAGYDRIFNSSKFHLAYVAVRDGASAGAVSERLGVTMAHNADTAAVSFGPPDALSEVFQLRDIRQLPRLLGVFLALLAVAAVGHALATAVRRRRRDLAVLRALGMTRRQCAGVIVTQASVLAVVGVAFGVPLGLALGRTVWREVTDALPLQYRAPWTVAVLLVIPAALVVANVIAAWPGRRAAHIRVADVLRAE